MTQWSVVTFKAKTSSAPPPTRGWEDPAESQAHPPGRPLPMCTVRGCPDVPMESGQEGSGQRTGGVGSGGSRDVATQGLVGGVAGVTRLCRPRGDGGPGERLCQRGVTEGRLGGRERWVLETPRGGEGMWEEQP